MSRFGNQHDNDLSPGGGAGANEPLSTGPTPLKVQHPPNPIFGGYRHDQPREGQPREQSQQVIHLVEPGPQTIGLEPKNRPTDWTVPAILACLCCRWPTGVVAIAYASKANTAYGMCDYVKAKKNADLAGTFTCISIILGIVIIIGSIFIELS